MKSHTPMVQQSLLLLPVHVDVGALGGPVGRFVGLFVVGGAVGNFVGRFVGLFVVGGTVGRFVGRFVGLFVGLFVVGAVGVGQ